MNCCNEYGKCKGGKGCPVGEPLPIDMLDDPADDGVIWLTPHGKIKQPDYTSPEIVANPAACASGLRDEWAHFGARVAG